MKSLYLDSCNIRIRYCFLKGKTYFEEYQIQRSLIKFSLHAKAIILFVIPAHKQEASFGRVLANSRNYFLREKTFCNVYVGETSEVYITRNLRLPFQLTQFIIPLD